MALVLWQFLIGYLVFSIILSIISLRASLVFIWCTLFFVPIPLLRFGFFRGFDILNIYTVLIFFFSLFNRNGRKSLGFIFRHYFKFLVIYVSILFLLFIFSETVPLKDQLRSYLREITGIFLILFSFAFALIDLKFVKVLAICLPIILVLNFIYSAFFELYLGYNPAGMPLLLLMGTDENAGATDMVESVRGMLSLRIQSTYGHPLSLGQFYLALVPMFFSMKGLNKFLNVIIILSLSISIFLSGARGAIFPLLLILFFLMVQNKIKHVFKFVLVFLSILIISYFLLPSSAKTLVNEYYESYSAMIQFWDESKQTDNDIKGSSVSMRMDQFSAAIEEVSPNPIFGMGIGYREYWQNIHGQSAHPYLLGYESLVLLKLVEQGWLGLFLYLWLLYRFYRIFSKGCHDKIYLKCLYWGVFLSQLMTGIRPHSLLFLGLASIVISYYCKNRHFLFSKSVV